MRRSWIPAIACLALAACSRAIDGDSDPSRAHDAHPTPGGAQAQSTPAVPSSTPPEALDDGAITRKVRAGLRGDPSLGDADITVNTDKGVVHLTGLVKSREQAAVASAHAQQDGVLRVDNQLAVDLR